MVWSNFLINTPQGLGLGAIVIFCKMYIEMYVLIQIPDLRSQIYMRDLDPHPDVDLDLDLGSRI